MLRPLRLFSEILDDFRAALAWLDASGCRASQSDRAGQYLEDVEEIARTWQTDGGDALIGRKGRLRLVESLMEADAIAAATGIVRRTPELTPGLASKLCVALEGPARKQAENPDAASTHPRNIFFEIRLLAWLVSAGLPAASGEHPDILTAVAGRPIHIECKRIFSANGIERRVAEAQRQLHRSLARDEAARGVIALDLARFVLPERGFVPYPDPAEFNRWMAETTRALRPRLETPMTRALKRRADPRIIGILQYFEVPACNLTTQRWGTGYLLEFVPIRDAEDETLRAFFETMRRSQPEGPVQASSRRT